MFQLKTAVVKSQLLIAILSRLGAVRFVASRDWSMQRILSLADMEILFDSSCSCWLRHADETLAARCLTYPLV
jgi:hypothetical protein